MSVGNTRSNTPAIRRAEVYSTLILDEIKDGFLPEGLHRDVTDFGKAHCRAKLSLNNVEAIAA